MSLRTLVPTISITAVILAFFFLSPLSTPAEVSSLTLIDAYATLPGESARVGFFELNQQINLLFIFDIESDSDETARLTWDVYDRHDNRAFSGERNVGCSDGENSTIIANAIPPDLGSGTQVYNVYASVSLGGLKDDTEFEIRIVSPPALPGVTIEDVRLTTRDDDSFIADEIGDAAVAYTLEIDFRAENIISWDRAEIRWFGVTSDGFVLDRGLGTTSVNEGFNSFDVDSYIARPPARATPQADFSVQVLVYGYFDSVTFPIRSLPVTLSELRTSPDIESSADFSIGEAYLLSGEGARASSFNLSETITARLLSGGIAPDNTSVVMQLSGGPDNTFREFMTRLEPGTELPVIDYHLPDDINARPGSYQFRWFVLTADTVFAERIVDFFIVGMQGIEIPFVLDLPGDATFTAPISWDVNLESETGLYATIITPSGVVCRILGHSLDEPLNVSLMADLFESNIPLSHVPSDATPLTTEETEFEGVWESIRRAYIGDGKVFVHDYWLYRIGDYEYQFLISTSSADENMISETYTASDSIRLGIILDN